ncbi:hypothetical protein [Dactylosporangium sp. NPDC005555]|uniref:hypothetical protein n=1 Tax=Dactylosporangium sp. NPDC005555 TaxID=3154889 RepID=UPI0033B87A7A
MVGSSRPAPARRRLLAVLLAAVLVWFAPVPGAVFAAPPVPPLGSLPGTAHRAPLSPAAPDGGR